MCVISISDYPEVVFDNDKQTEDILPFPTTSFSNSRILQEFLSFDPGFWYACNYCEEEYEDFYNASTANTDSVNGRILSSLSMEELPPFNT